MDPQKLQTINHINIGGVNFGFAPININVIHELDDLVEKGENDVFVAADVAGAKTMYQLYLQTDLAVRMTTDAIKSADRAAEAAEAVVDDVNETKSALDTLTGEGDGSIVSIVNNIIANTGHLQNKVVAAPPTVEDAEADTIYLVRTDEPGVYDRYMLVVDENDQKYILNLTSTRVDLDNYYNKEEIDTKLEGIGSNYELPIAGLERLGGIKVGRNLTIDEDGTLNAQAGGGGTINPDDLDTDASDEETAEVFAGAGQFFEQKATEIVQAAIDAQVIPLVEERLPGMIDEIVDDVVPAAVQTAMDEFKTTLDMSATDEEVEEVFG